MFKKCPFLYLAFTFTSESRERHFLKASLKRLWDDFCGGSGVQLRAPGLHQPECLLWPQYECHCRESSHHSQPSIISRARYVLLKQSSVFALGGRIWQHKVPCKGWRGALKENFERLYSHDVMIYPSQSFIIYSQCRN